MIQNMSINKPKPRSPIGDTVPISAQVGVKLICAFCKNQAGIPHMCEEMRKFHLQQSEKRNETSA